MRKQKGAALPSAIMVVILLMAVTFGVSYLVIHNATLRRVEANNAAKRVEFAEAYEKFKANGEIPAMENSTYVYSKLEEAMELTGKKAIIAKTKGGRMDFYAIYDFDGNKTLAYQTEDFYITVIGEKSYLGGLLEMPAGGIL